MRTQSTCLLFAAALLSHGLAHAGGYEGWRFGMTHEQVKAVGDPSRYYGFKNGDLGAGKQPFEGGDALLSFYFKGDHMERVMLIPYMGDDLKQGREAWRKSLDHLTRVCGGVESPSLGKGAAKPEAVMAAWDEAVPLMAPGERHQMGCSPMPGGERIWASATRGAGTQVMVSVNYGEP
ncbi:hypothetical protein [Massilia aerilata]|uniref:Uncharacterized protein n=1 Tax=Massilia aerilata TaxID=453817 RepID=A0ABW0RWN8_9BURK